MLGSLGSGPRPPSRPLNKVVEDAVRLPTEPVRDLTTWLASGENADLAPLLPTLAAADTLDGLCLLLSDSRVGFLAHLKQIGVIRLAERQAVANRLGRDRREGRIVFEGETQQPTPLPTPTQLPAHTAQVPPPAMRSDSTVESRDASPDVDADAVMQAIRERRPSTALQSALALRDSANAWILRARALVAMGSLSSAALAYDRAAAANEDATSQPVVQAEKATLMQLITVSNTIASMAPLFFPRQVAMSASAHGVAAPPTRDGKYATHDARTRAKGAASAPPGDASAADPGERDDPVEIGYRLWRCPTKPARGRAARAVLLYFHGNGEIASDYDSFSELYNMMGLHLMVVDFRGYGWSTDAPTLASALLSDAEPLLTEGALEAALRASGIDARGLPVLLFGRSMGANVAIHLAAFRPSRFAGLVVESGLISMATVSLGSGGAAVDEAQEVAAYEEATARVPRVGGVEHVGLFENVDKLRACTMPTLILHGTADHILPPSQAKQAHRVCGAERKTLRLIEGAGHNDISMCEEYFSSIARFVDEVLEGN